MLPPACSVFICGARVRVARLRRRDVGGAEHLADVHVDGAGRDAVEEPIRAVDELRDVGGVARARPRAGVDLERIAEQGVPAHSHERVGLAHVALRRRQRSPLRRGQPALPLRGHARLLRGGHLLPRHRDQPLETGAMRGCIGRVDAAAAGRVEQDPLELGERRNPAAGEDAPALRPGTPPQKSDRCAVPGRPLDAQDRLRGRAVGGCRPRPRLGLPARRLGLARPLGAAHDRGLCGSGGSGRGGVCTTGGGSARGS